MNLLAIDTSTKFLSVAVAEDKDILASFRDDGNLKHSASLIPTIDNLLKKCNLTLKNIDTIALSIGPGSFTGLRIGVATCKAINLALGIPIISVPTLDVIAHNFINAKEEMLCPLIDAKKAKVYACLYRSLRAPRSGAKQSHAKGIASSVASLPPRNDSYWNKQKLEKFTDYMLADIGEVLERIDKPTLVFGDGIGLYGDSLKKNPLVSVSIEDWHPKAEVVARLGFQKAGKRQFANADKLVPMYLHSQYCQVRMTNDKAQNSK